MLVVSDVLLPRFEKLITHPRTSREAKCLWWKSRIMLRTIPRNYSGLVPRRISAAIRPDFSSLRTSDCTPSAHVAERHRGAGRVLGLHLINPKGPVERQKSVKQQES
jgi:hypothetical protein